MHSISFFQNATNTTVLSSSSTINDDFVTGAASRVSSVSLPIIGQGTSPHHRLPILISGAGIAGLTLACALNDMNRSLDNARKVSYLIIEREADPSGRNQGYGLTLLKETVSYLKEINIYPLLEQRTVTMTGGYESRNSKGDLIDVDLKTDPSQLKIILSRKELREQLLDQVGRTNILWNTTAVAFQSTSRGILARIQTAGGGTDIEFANLIAADGINSTIRTSFAKDEKKYLGVLGVYGRIPNQQATEHLNHEFQVDDFKGWRLFCKPYNVEYYNWQLFFPWEEKKPLPSSKEMLDWIGKELKVRNWKEEYIELIKETDVETMRLGLLFDRDPLHSLPQSLPVTFIGDAAHPVSPYKGRGANLAIQGVRIFVEETKKALESSLGEIDWATINRAYESKFWPLAAPVQLSCRQSVWQHHFKGDPND